MTVITIGDETHYLDISNDADWNEETRVYVPNENICISIADEDDYYGHCSIVLTRAQGYELLEAVKKCLGES